MLQKKKPTNEEQFKLKAAWHLEDAKCLQCIWMQQLATPLQDFAGTAASCSDALFEW